MPGVKVTPWAALHATKATAADERVRAVETALAKLKVERVSARSLRTLAGLEGIHRNVYADVLAKVKGPGWSREGRSFVRNPFA